MSWRLETFSIDEIFLWISISVSLLFLIRSTYVGHALQDLRGSRHERFFSKTLRPKKKQFDDCSTYPSLTYPKTPFRHKALEGDILGFPEFSALRGPEVGGETRQAKANSPIFPMVGRWKSHFFLDIFRGELLSKVYWFGMVLFYFLFFFWPKYRSLQVVVS